MVYDISVQKKADVPVDLQKLCHSELLGFFIIFLVKTSYLKKSPSFRSPTFLQDKMNMV